MQGSHKATDGDVLPWKRAGMGFILPSRNKPAPSRESMSRSWGTPGPFLLPLGPRGGNALWCAPAALAAPHGTEVAHPFVPLGD